MSTRSLAQWTSRASLLALLTGGVLPAVAQTFRVVAPDTVPPGNFSQVPEGCFLSPSSVTGPGEMVAGSSVPPTSFFPGQSQAFVWTQATGAVALGFLPGDIGSSAAAISHQGGVIVGTSYTPIAQDLGTTDQAFVWTASAGMSPIGFLAPEDGAQSDATAVSENGLVAVGYASAASGLSHAFRWTAAGGIVDLGSLGGDFSVANGVSADGAVVTGYLANAAGDFQGFRWSTAKGMTVLPLPAGDDSCVFAAVSGDGKVIIGQGYNSTSTAPTNSFVWTKSSGSRDLGTLEATANTQALAVSRDGSVVVGFSDGKAFRWTAKTGIQSIQSIQSILMQNKHLAKVLAGWDLTMATGISPNGRKIVGVGVDPAGDQQGWVAEIPLE